MAGRPCPNCAGALRPHCTSAACPWWRCDACRIVGGRYHRHLATTLWKLLSPATP